MYVYAIIYIRWCSVFNNVWITWYERTNQNEKEYHIIGSRAADDACNIALLRLWWIRSF